MEVPDGNGGTKTEQIPMRNAMNDVTRGSYVKDCEMGVTRWNRLIEKAGHSFRLALPSARASVATSESGRACRPIRRASRLRRKNSMRSIARLAAERGDQAYILSLMHGVHEQGKMAAWIAPPDRGINNNPVDYEYVKLH